MTFPFRTLARLITSLDDFQLSRLLGHIHIRELRRIRKRVLQAEGFGSAGITIANEVSALLNCVNSKSLPLSVIDAGAHIGDYTAEILAQSPSTKVYAFEPNPQSFEIIKNRFLGDERVSAIEKALGKSSSNERLFFDRGGSSLSSLVKRDLRHFGLEFSENVMVEVVRLSSWCKINSVQPVALKLDIEGAELPVLQDAVQNIESLQRIAFEFGGANLDSRTVFRDFHDLFSENNWIVARLTGSGLIDIPTYTEFDEVFVKTDFVARKNVGR